VLYKNMRRIIRLSFCLFTLCVMPLSSGGVHDSPELIEYFNDRAVPLNEGSDLDELISNTGSSRLVLLGEASHGTSEFYQWRSEITRRLITEKGFSFVAVEGDWASIYRLNKYVKGLPGARSSARRVLQGFDRWPEWMWANNEIRELAEWMRNHNRDLPDDRKVGFYGMDVYGQWEAMDDLINYAGEYLPEYHDEISRNLQCFANYDRDEWVYARAVTSRGHPSCEKELQEVVDLLYGLSPDPGEKGRREFFRAKQNALVVKNAEDFFRLAITDNAGSWNSRATHMWETVRGLLNEYGSSSRAIVWAHNTHVGDAGATSMQYQGMVNIGQLSRGELGRDQVFIAGFGTGTGRVSAGSQWGARMERMQVPEGIEGSLENILSQLNYDRFYLLFDEQDRSHPLLSRFIGHRAIGVVYNPAQESLNYVPTILPQRYDAFIFIRKTGPLQPVR
jgi:erythromycin esterase